MWLVGAKVKMDPSLRWGDGIDFLPVA